MNHRFDSKSSICKDGVVLATPIDRNNYIGLTRYQGLAMTENSRSESMEDAAQQSLLERHRSPSATEVTFCIIITLMNCVNYSANIFKYTLDLYKCEIVPF